MIRSLLVGPISAVALCALAHAAPAQEGPVSDAGPDPVCNTLVDKTHKPVRQRGGAGSVLTAQTYDCPEAGPEPSARIEPAAGASLPAGGVIYFELGRANLDAAGAASLAAVIADIKGRQLGGISVAGHTDTSGAADYNLKLSQRRANAVATELIKAGVPAQLISTAGYGQTELAVPTADGVVLPANRRVVIDVAP